MKKIVVAGMIILISISPLFRGLFFDYETYGFLAGLALLSIIYFFIKIAKHEPVRINKLYLLAGVLLLAAVCFSFAGALNRRETIEALFLYLELLIVFIVLYDFFYNMKKQFIQAIMPPVLMSGVVAAFVGMMALTGRFNVWQVTVANNRVGSTFQYSNTASVYFLICFMFAVTLANLYKECAVRSIMTGLGAVTLFAFIMTGSRGGFLTGIVMLLVMIVIQPNGMRLRTLAGMFCSAAGVFTVMKRFNEAVAAHDNFEAAKWIIASFVIASAIYYIIASIMKMTVERLRFSVPKWTGLVLAASAVMLVVIVILFRERFVQILPEVMASRLERLLSNGLQEKNVLFRLEFDKDALKLISQYWLTGLGGNGWKALYQSVQDFFYTAAYVHNNYFQVFVDHGILGFISYTILVVITAASLIYSYLKAGDRLLKTCVAGLFCGFIALAVHSAADFDLSFISLILLFWVMFAAAAVDPPKSSDSGDSDGRSGRLVDLFGFAQKGRWKTEISGNVGKLAMVAVCSLLFSMYALYFTAAYNSQAALDFMQKRDYKDAMAYYEEANRLDPANTSYIFELAKIYHYYGRKSADSEIAAIWLDKARNAGELSVRGNANYPAYMNTLVRIYLDSDMPLEALDLAGRLVECQKYNAEVYELLSRSYIDAARYYYDSGDGGDMGNGDSGDGGDRGDRGKAKELLELCVRIDNDPYLRRSVIDRPDEVGSEEVLESYRHSDELAGYLKEAEDILQNLE